MIETEVFECIVIYFFCPVIHTLIRMSYLRVDDLNRYFRKHISFDMGLIKFNQLKGTGNFENFLEIEVLKQTYDLVNVFRNKLIDFFT